MGYKSLLSLIAIVGFLPLIPVSSAQAHGYLQTNLVSDKNAAAVAPRNDPNLLNPWGIANIAGGPFWISDNGSGFSSLYDGTGKPNAQLPQVTIPTATITGTSAPASPDGIVWNGNFLNSSTQRARARQYLHFHLCDRGRNDFLLGPRKSDQPAAS